MDFFSSKRLVMTALVILVVLNASLLGFLWWQNIYSPVNKGPEAPEGRQFDKHMPHGYELTLNEAQKQKFMTLRREHFRQSQPVLRQIVELKKELVNEALKEKPDSVKIAAIADEIGKKQAVIERSLAMHFHELAGVCAPGQLDSLKTMLERVYTRRYERGRPWGGNRLPGEQPSAPPAPMNNP